MPSEPITFEPMADEAEMGTTKCLDCGAEVHMPLAVLAMFPRQHCNACEARARGEAEAVKARPLSPVEELARRWSEGEDALCPPVFRDTDPKRLEARWGDFALTQVWNWKPHSSKGFIFRGPSGCGKTRLMLELFRRLHFAGHSVKIIWPEDFSDMAVRAAREGETGPTVRRLCAPQILGLDDGFIAGAADERSQRFLFALADARYRQCKPLFLTTQMTSAEHKAAANKWADLGAAGLKRIDAIFRRLKCTTKLVVPYDDPTYRLPGNEEEKES